MKLMAFIEPKLMKKYYSLITDEYGEIYEKFFKYFEKTWISQKNLENILLFSIIMKI